MLKEFKDFISGGNMLEVAVGLIMASTFGAIIKSLVDNILMPLVGAAVSGIDFKDWVVNVAGVDLGIGIFINAISAFLHFCSCGTRTFVLRSYVADIMFHNCYTTSSAPCALLYITYALFLTSFTSFTSDVFAFVFNTFSFVNFRWTFASD